MPTVPLPLGTVLSWEGLCLIQLLLPPSRPGVKKVKKKAPQHPLEGLEFLKIVTGPSMTRHRGGGKRGQTLHPPGKGLIPTVLVGLAEAAHGFLIPKLAAIANGHIALVMFSGVDLGGSEDAILRELFLPVG